MDFSYKMGFYNHSLQLCIPITLGLFTQLAASNGVSCLIVGHFAPMQSAAHNVVINLCSIIFMVPLAISIATSIKVGYFFGKRDLAKIKQFTFNGLFLTVIFSLFTAFVFYVFPSQIVSVFSIDKNVITLATKLLLIVAVYQLFDGIQETVSGILRGMGISLPYFISTVISYWLIGVPLAYYLAVEKYMAAVGVWISLTLGIFTLAISLSWYLYKMSNLPVFKSQKHPLIKNEAVMDGASF